MATTQSAIDQKMDSQVRGGSTSQIVRQLQMENEKAWLTIGAIAEMMGDNEQTYQAYEKVLANNRMNAQALFALGCCCESQEQYAKAADCFHHLVTLNGTNGEAWGHLAYCYLMQNELSSSYSAYQHALYYIQNPKDATLWYGIGLLYDRYGSLDHAEESFEAVMKMNPPESLRHEVGYRLGIIAKQRGQYDVALDRLRQVLEQTNSPSLAGDVWSQIGHVYELTNDIRLAKSSYLKVVERNPKNAKAYQQLGWLCLKAGNENEGAIDYLKKAVNADPKDGKGWYLLGRCYMAINDCEEAYHAYKQAVNCDQSNPNVWCSLGVLFYQLSQYLDALDAYSRAINLNPNICEVWYNVGTLYDTCNQTNDARDAYQKAAELGADAQFIRERLDMLTAKENGAPSTTPPPGPSEPPTSAPMGSGRPGQAADGSYPQGRLDPLMPSPATTMSMAGRPAASSTSSMVSPIPSSAPMAMHSSRGMAVQREGGNTIQSVQGGMNMSNRGHPHQLNMMQQQQMAQRNEQLPLRGMQHPRMGGQMPQQAQGGMQQGGMSLGRLGTSGMGAEGRDGVRDHYVDDKKMGPPPRLAGLDPKSVRRGPPQQGDQLQMPPMADSKPPSHR